MTHQDTNKCCKKCERGEPAWHWCFDIACPCHTKRDKCKIVLGSSRQCELGTEGCIFRHTKQNQTTDDSCKFCGVKNTETDLSKHNCLPPSPTKDTSAVERIVQGVYIPYSHIAIDNEDAVDGYEMVDVAAWLRTTLTTFEAEIRGERNDDRLLEIYNAKIDGQKMERERILKAIADMRITWKESNGDTDTVCWGTGGMKEILSRVCALITNNQS